MTKLLEKAFAEASKLPEQAQDRIAANLLQELADDAKWDASFAASASQLERLAAEALEEYRPLSPRPSVQARSPAAADVLSSNQP